MMQRVLFFGLFALCCAESMVWTGQGTNNLWSNVANWNPTKPPQADDDCVINIAGTTVLIGTTEGAQCGSLTTTDGVTVNVNGAPVTFGSLKATGNSIFNINAGAFQFTASSATFQDRSTMVWSSGIIAGKFSFVYESMCNINSKGGLLNATGGWYIDTPATVNIVNSRVSFNGIPMTNNGAFNIRSSTIYQLALFDFCQGSTTVDGITTVGGSVDLCNLRVLGQLIVSPNSDVTISVGLSHYGTITINEPSTTHIYGDSITSYSSSLIQINGAKAVLEMDCVQYKFDSLQISQGRFKTNDGSIRNVTMNGGEFDGEGHAELGIVTTQGDVKFSGGGNTTIDSAVFNGNVVIQSRVFGLELTFNGKQVTLDGILQIPKLSNFQLLSSSFWGPSKASKPGLLHVDGDLQIGQRGLPPVTVTMNSLRYSGQGNWYMYGNFDLQSMNVTAGNIWLGVSNCSISGESLNFGYPSITGYKQGGGQEIGRIVDSGYSSCNTPCPAWYSGYSMQSYRTWVATP